MKLPAQSLPTKTHKPSKFSTNFFQLFTLALVFWVGANSMDHHIDALTSTLRSSAASGKNPYLHPSTSAPVLTAISTIYELLPSPHPLPSYPTQAAVLLAETLYMSVLSPRVQTHVRAQGVSVLAYLLTPLPNDPRLEEHVASVLDALRAPVYVSLLIAQGMVMDELDLLVRLMYLPSSAQRILGDMAPQDVEMVVANLVSHLDSPSRHRILCLLASFSSSRMGYGCVKDEMDREIPFVRATIEALQSEDSDVVTAALYLLACHAMPSSRGRTLFGSAMLGRVLDTLLSLPRHHPLLTLTVRAMMAVPWVPGALSIVSEDHESLPSILAPILGELESDPAAFELLFAFAAHSKVVQTELCMACLDDADSVARALRTHSQDGALSPAMLDMVILVVGSDPESATRVLAPFLETELVTQMGDKALSSRVYTLVMAGLADPVLSGKLCMGSNTALDLPSLVSAYETCLSSRRYEPAVRFFHVIHTLATSVRAPGASSVLEAITTGMSNTILHALTVVASSPASQDLGSFALTFLRYLFVRIPDPHFPAVATSLGGVATQYASEIRSRMISIDDRGSQLRTATVQLNVLQSLVGASTARLVEFNASASQEAHGIHVLPVKDSDLSRSAFALRDIHQTYESTLHAVTSDASVLVDRLEASHAQVHDLASAKTSVTSQVRELEAEIERLQVFEAEVPVLESRIVSLSGHVEELEAALDTLREAHGSSLEELARVRGEKEDVEHEVQRVRNLYTQLHSAHDDLNVSAASALTTAESHRASVSRLESTVHRLQVRLEGAEGEAERALTALRSAEDQISAQRSEIERHRVRIGELLHVVKAVSELCRE